MPLKSGDQLSHYRLIEKVGTGGMGVVWKAYDTVLERPVAIKVLPDQVAADRLSLARFEREARTLAALSHPGIVTVYSVEAHDDTHFITMEWIAGRTLAEAIPPDGLPLPRLLEVVRSVVAAVAAAEEQGIAHRDLKPANVMLGNSGHVKVLDFGLAQSAAEQQPAKVSSVATTRPMRGESGLAGTLHYMSPEQLRGGRVDSRTDIFALGVLIYELATGRRPFDGASVAEITAAILRDEPVAVTDVRMDLPAQLDWIVRRCLAKDPDERFQKVRELAREIDALDRERPEGDAEDQSIGVLPFVDMSQEHDQEYFCQGVAEEIINALSHVSNLHVASRASAFRFGGLSIDPREVGRRLGVRALLTGSVRKSGQRVRITTELTAAAGGYRLWSERFDRDLRDIFAVQDEIAESVVQALRVSLSPRERRAIRSVATTDARAYEHYLRGRQVLYQQSRRAIEVARQMFNRAIELDPNYALAHSGLADACSFVYLYVDRSPIQRESALEASRKALELDPDLGQAHVSYGVAMSLFSRSQEALAAYERALELEPRSYEAHFFYAREARMLGDNDKAAQMYERACEINPADYQAPALLAQVYADLGRDREAEVMRRRALANADERLREVPDDVRAMYLSANVLVALGEVKRGLERAAQASRLDPDDCMLLYNVACILAKAGRHDEALSNLERSVMVGNIQTRYFRHDTDLDALRAMPRFEALMRMLEVRDRSARPAV